MRKRIFHFIKVVLLGLIVIIISSYYINECTESKRKKQKKAELRRELNGKISQLASKYSALKYWEKSITDGKKYRINPILSIELEEIWLKGKPILFVGKILDISSDKNESYNILIEYSLISSRILLPNSIRLDLKMTSSLGFLIRERYAEQTDNSLSGIVVIALIENIQKYNQGKNENDQDIIIGKGKCLDALFLNNLLDLYVE